jgi:hypothetical protein
LPTEGLLVAIGDQDAYFSAEILTLYTMSSSNIQSELQGKVIEVAYRFLKEIFLIFTAIAI